jgi:hypothetical protein
MGKNCLEFSGEADFVAGMEKVLSMSDQEIEKMRGAVWDCYDWFLNPNAFGGRLGMTGLDRILVDAEERSVSWVRDFQAGVGAFMAKYSNKFNHETHQMTQKEEVKPRITRMDADDKKGHAGTPGARAGGVFAGPLPSELEDGPSKTPLHSLRE